jgi:hypothetical protein
VTEWRLIPPTPEERRQGYAYRKLRLIDPFPYPLPSEITVRGELRERVDEFWDWKGRQIEWFH